MSRSNIISALRRLWWQRDDARKAAIKLARKARGKYLCAICKQLFPQNKLQVDHIKPVGKFKDWNQFMKKLFCDINNLQCLCKECHLMKTKAQK